MEDSVKPTGTSTSPTPGKPSHLAVCSIAAQLFTSPDHLPNIHILWLRGEKTHQEMHRVCVEKVPSFWTADKITTPHCEETLQNIDTRMKITLDTLSQSCTQPAQTEMKEWCSGSSHPPELGSPTRPVSPTVLLCAVWGTNQAHMPSHLFPSRSFLLDCRGKYIALFWHFPSSGKLHQTLWS